MKKKFIALLLIASTFATSSSLILAKETNSIKEEIVLEKDKQKPIVMLRESDWGDENYGNWKELAKDPEKKAKILKCLGEKLLGLGFGLSAEAVLEKLVAGNILFFGTAYVILATCLFD